jgi:hypothetical protein
MFVCVGKFGIVKFLNRQGCGEKWGKDTVDGKCPICRGNLIPEFMVTEVHKRNMKK